MEWAAKPDMTFVVGVKLSASPSKPPWKDIRDEAVRRSCVHQRCQTLAAVTQEEMPPEISKMNGRRRKSSRTVPPNRSNLEVGEAFKILPRTHSFVVFSKLQSLGQRTDSHPRWPRQQTLLEEAIGGRKVYHSELRGRRLLEPRS